MDRFCRHCGTQLQPGDEFCGSCGLALSDEPASESAPGHGQHESAEGGPYPGSRTGWIIAAVVVVALVVVGGALAFMQGGDDGTASPTPMALTPSQAPSGEPSATGSPQVEPSDARLEGTFRMEIVATSSNVEGIKGEEYPTVLAFKPRCQEGACDTAMSTKPTILLTHDGASYIGAESGPFGSTCNGKDIDSEMTYKLRATRVQDGTVVRLEGKAIQAIAGQEGCGAAKAGYSVRAFSSTKPVTDGSGVPPIALEDYPPLNSPWSASDYLLQSWLDDDRPGAEWAGDADAVDFLWSIKRKDYRLTCSGLGYLEGTHCGLLLHKQKWPIIIFQLRTNDDPQWKVKNAYWNAE